MRRPVPGEGTRNRHAEQMEAISAQDSLIRENTAAVDRLNENIGQLIVLIEGMGDMARQNAAALAELRAKFGKMALTADGKLRMSAI